MFVSTLRSQLKIQPSWGKWSDSCFEESLDGVARAIHVVWIRSPRKVARWKVVFPYAGRGVRSPMAVAAKGRDEERSGRSRCCGVRFPRDAHVSAAPSNASVSRINTSSGKRQALAPWAARQLRSTSRRRWRDLFFDTYWYREVWHSISRRKTFSKKHSWDVRVV